MASLAELRAADHRQWSLLWVVEDLPVAFTNDERLVGYPMFGDGREILPGLKPPDWTLSIDPKADWMLGRNEVNIEICDLEGVVGQYFGRTYDGTEEPLVFSIEPSDDLTLLTNLHDRHVGTEYIGPNGERNYYTLLGGARPRFHAGEDIQGGENGIAPVSETVRVINGRRCALFQVWYDWTEGGDPDVVPILVRRWWGTVRGANNDLGKRAWKIKCDGPESWLYRRLGAISQGTPVSVQPVLSSQASTSVSVGLWTQRANGENQIAYSFTIESLPTTDYSRTDVIDAFRAAIIAARVDVSSGAAFVDTPGNQVGIGDNGIIGISVADLDTNEREAVLAIDAPIWAWNVVGYDPLLQRQLSYGDDFWVYFDRYLGVENVVGYFRTIDQPPGVSPEDDELDNGGEVRQWRPLYPGGAWGIYPTARPIIRLGLDTVVAIGQFDKPVEGSGVEPDDPINVEPGIPANAHGYWLIYGPRRYEDRQETFMEYQVARCVWANSVGYEVLGSQGPAVRVVGWEDPRAFGFDRPKLSTPWVMPINPSAAEVEPLRAVPIMRLGYGNPTGAGEPADVLLARMMYCTGESTGWSSFSYDPAATLDLGSNDPGWVEPIDAEVFDLGLGIDSLFITPPSAWNIMEPLAGLGTIQRASVNFVGGMESETILRSLCAPRGWAMGLQGGRYTPFVFDQLVPPQDTVVLDMSTKRTRDRGGRLQHSPKQTLNAIAPKDEYELLYDWDPLAKKTQHSLKIPSPDAGRIYRHTREDRGKGAGGRVHASTIQAANAPFQRLPGHWHVRARDLAQWAARDHFLVKDYPLMPLDGSDVSIYPGQRVTLTDPELWNPATAVYGVAGVQGIVIKTTVKDGGREQTADILVDGRTLVQQRVHAPSARGRGYDPATSRLYVDDDWLGNGGIADVNGFVEPVWSVRGGQARIQVWQWDGTTWSVTCTGIVDSVDDTPGSAHIVLDGGLSGTYRRDDEAVVTLQPYTSQDAEWVLALFAPVSDQDGTWSTGNVVPWAA